MELDKFSQVLHDQCLSTDQDMQCLLTAFQNLLVAWMWPDNRCSIIASSHCTITKDVFAKVTYQSDIGVHCSQRGRDRHSHPWAHWHKTHHWDKGWGHRLNWPLTHITHTHTLTLASLTPMCKASYKHSYEWQKYSNLTLMLYEKSSCYRDVVPWLQSLPEYWGGQRQTKSLVLVTTQLPKL